MYWFLCRRIPDEREPAAVQLFQYDANSLTMSYSDLHAVLRAINRERGNRDPLPNKSLHKLLYRIDVKAVEADIDITIPYYWYLFGTVSPASPTTVPTSPTKKTGLARELRPIVAEVLSEYYDHGLEWLTDQMYTDAPYEVQRAFRQLDKKVRTLHPEYNDFYEVTPSRDSILASVHSTYDELPVEQYSECKRAQVKWYNVVTRELYSHSPTPDRLMRADVFFWRVFALELAQQYTQAMSLEEVRGDLGISSFSAAQEHSVSRLLEMEQADLNQQFSETAGDPLSIRKAGDALTEPLLEERGISLREANAD